MGPDPARERGGDARAIQVEPRVADLRKGAREAGRSPLDLLIFTLLTVIVGHQPQAAAEPASATPAPPKAD